MAKRHRSRAGDLQSAFLRLEELVLANSGQDEFEEVFKLVIAKLFDEVHLGGTAFSGAGEPSEVGARIERLLRKADEHWPGLLPPLPSFNLTSEHLAVCVRELERHELHNEALETFDEFFEFLVARTAKGNKGQYFTPRHVVEMCVRMLDPQPGERIADPACGSGAFLLHALHHVRSQGSLEGKERSSFWGFDLDDRAVRIARALSRIGGDGEIQFFRLNSLLKSALPANLFPDQTMPMTVEEVVGTRTPRNGVFDVILTNPPFAGEIQEPNLLRLYELSLTKKKVERDILFVERCIDLLRPGGRLAIVLPYNKLTAAPFMPLRRWCIDRCHMLAVVGLGRHVFMPHTQQKVGVLFVRKKKHAGERSSKSIFFAISEKDGKDSRGRHVFRSPQLATAIAPAWDKLDHDLDQVVDGFSNHRLGR